MKITRPESLTKLRGLVEREYSFSNAVFCTAQFVMIYDNIGAIENGDTVLAFNERHDYEAAAKYNLLGLSRLAVAANGNCLFLSIGETVGDPLARSTIINFMKNELRQYMNMKVSEAQVIKSGNQLLTAMAGTHDEQKDQ
ncbi:hypothetical protein AKO1_013230, partial [Acrasis kona]